jgi:ferredoxin
MLPVGSEPRRDSMATKTLRNLVVIDESKCTGCGLCATACAEGAIQIVDGKAKLLAEQYCDGLGACLGECPEGAIAIEQREAEEFDVEATEQHLRRVGRNPASHQHVASGSRDPRPETRNPSPHAGCPSAIAQAFAPATAGGRTTGQPSALGQWPVQLTLVPPAAPYFQDADLLVTADCVPFAYADYHADLLAGKAVVVGCPKLDDTGFYVEKLAAILTASEVRSVTVAIMEVPCCRGLLRVVEQAVAQSGKAIPVKSATISIRGEKRE